MEENVNQKKMIDYLFDNEWKGKHVCWGGGIEITTNCNFKCIHCYLEGSHLKNNYMHLDMFKNIVDQLFENGVIFVYLTGGEIFLHKDFKEMYLYLKRKGFIVELLTNISLLTDEIINIFREYPPFNISISLYGSNTSEYEIITKNHNAYEMVINSLKKLKDNNLPFEIKSPVLKETISYIWELKRIADSFGVKFTYFDNIFPIFDKTKNNDSHCVNANELVELERQDVGRSKLWCDLFKMSKTRTVSDECDVYLCHFGSDTFFITYDGFVEGCNRMRLNNCNIKDLSFQECWKQIDVERKRVCKTKDYKCASCIYSKICQPCPADNVLFTKNELQPPKIKCEKCYARYERFGK